MCVLEPGGTAQEGDAFTGAAGGPSRSKRVNNLALGGGGDAHNAIGEFYGSLFRAGTGANDECVSVKVLRTNKSECRHECAAY